MPADKPDEFRIFDEDPGRDDENLQLLMDGLDLASDQGRRSWITSAATSRRLAMIIPVDDAERLEDPQFGKPRWEDRDDDTLTNEEIGERLQQFAEGGLIRYVLGTDPLGEKWVLGLYETDGFGDMVHLHGKSEAIAFLMALQVAAMLSRALRADPLGERVMRAKAAARKQAAKSKPPA